MLVDYICSKLSLLLPSSSILSIILTGNSYQQKDQVPTLLTHGLETLFAISGFQSSISTYALAIGVPNAVLNKAKVVSLRNYILCVLHIS
jgi:hypothetical protein